MLNVTSQARVELLAMLVQTLEQMPATPNEGEDIAFRIVSSEGALGLALDATREGDTTIDHDGFSVLLVDAATSDALDGLTLDIVETSQGRSLTLRD
jgi:Fe-S cluster assembly iron-binding protein IscA